MQAATPATEPEAIFVVGVGRSGTKMMRTLLEGSPRIAIAPENHFMGHYFGRRGARHVLGAAGDLGDDATIRRVVSILYDGEFARHSRWRKASPFWRWLLAEVPREEMEQRLLAAERSQRGMFGAFMRAYADRHGKSVMGEKTPTHLAHVDTLLEWFPNARVIHMLRDPRAVYVSDRYRREVKGRPPYSWIARLPLALGTWLLFMTIHSWRRAATAHAQLEEAHRGRYLMVRFEDVVREPAATLDRLSAFLGVRVEVEPEAVRVATAHGMRSSAEGIDPAAADRWRERIHPIAKRIVELFLGAAMRRHGYIGVSAGMD